MDFQHSRLVTFLRSVFGSKNKKASNPSIEKEAHLEPRYWPEVIDFMATIKTIVNNNTINEGHVKSLNDRIISYVEKEINQKGELEDPEERYKALDLLADRILVVNLSKLVGLKKNLDTHPVFTEAVATLKNRLHDRKQQETNYDQNKKQQP